MDYERAYGWKGNTIHESEMALLFECTLWCARKVLDTADIVRKDPILGLALVLPIREFRHCSLHCCR
jgi:hypothetical protein